MILAVDDDPGRYDYLRVLLNERGDDAPRFVVATCRECVESHIPHATAILLDFDLDGREECARCNGWIDVTNATAYLDAVIARGVPVIVSSCSSNANRKHLVTQLHERGVKVAGIAADHFGVEREWLGPLWVWGVVSARGGPHGR